MLSLSSWIESSWYIAMKRSSKEQNRKDTFGLFNEQLFCILYPTLFHINKDYIELSPSEIYMEAMSLSKFLMECRRLDMIEDEVTDMMAEKYATFEMDSERVERDGEEASRTSFLVQMTALYQIVALGKLQKTDKYKPCCQLLVKLTQHHHLLDWFMEEVRMTEDKEELQGRRVEIVNLMCNEKDESPDKVFDSFVACAKEYPDNVVESMLTVVTDFSEMNGHRYDTYAQSLRKELKKRVKNQQEPRTLHSERTYFPGATHNDYGRYLNMEGQKNNDKMLDNYE